jgi:hypothetical protein
MYSEFSRLLSANNARKEIAGTKEQILPIIKGVLS